MKTPFARRSIAKASLLAISFALMLSVLPSPRVRSDDTRLIPLADTRVEFRQDVLPILLKHCSDCHGTTKQKGGLRLDSLPALWKGGASGEVVLPGQSAESPLIHHVSALEDTPRMPPKGDLLTPVQIEVLRKWIDQETKETQAASLAAADTLPSLWSMSPLERANAPTHCSLRSSRTAPALTWRRSVIFLWARARPT